MLFEYRGGIARRRALLRAHGAFGTARHPPDRRLPLRSPARCWSPAPRWPGSSRQRRPASPTPPAPCGAARGARRARRRPASRRPSPRGTSRSWSPARRRGPRRGPRCRRSTPFADEGEPLPRSPSRRPSRSSPPTSRPIRRPRPGHRQPRGARAPRGRGARRVGGARGRARPEVLQRRGPEARHPRAGEDHRAPDRGARPLRHPGPGHRRRRRPAHHPLRAAPRPRREDEQGRAASRTTWPTRWPRPTSASSPRSPASRPSASRSPTPTARSSRSATSSRRGPKDWSPLTVWLGKDVSGKADRRRPGQDAAHPRRRHHRRRQVGLHQRDALSSILLQARARRGPAGARRPQAGRAQPLRERPAPAHAGDHVARAAPPTRCRTSSARWSGATGSWRWPARARCPSSTRYRVGQRGRAAARTSSA